MRNLLLNKWGPELITPEGLFVFEALNPENEKTLYAPREKTLEETVEDTIGDGYDITKSINSDLFLVHDEDSEYKETPNSLDSTIKWGLRKVGIQNQMGKWNYTGLAKAACVPLALLTAYSVVPKVFTASAYAADLDISLVPGFPKQIGYDGGSVFYDLDGDGIDEVIVTGANVHVWHLDGTSYLNKAGGVLFQLGNKTPTPPAIADITGDGKEEIIVLANGIYVLNLNGELVLPKLDVGGNSGLVPPVIADLDLDGKPEIIATSYHSTLVYVYRNNGKLMPGFPMEDVVYSSPAVADLDPNFSGLELVWGKRYGKVMAIHYDCSLVPGFPVGQGGGPLSTSPAIGDVDNNGKPEIVINTPNGTLSVIDSNGQLKPGWPQKTEGFEISSPAIADVYNDGNLSIFIGGRNGYFYGFKSNGVLLPGFPKKIGPDEVYIRSSAVVADIDNDNILEVLIGSPDGRIGSLNGKLYAFKTTTGELVPGFPIDYGKPVDDSPIVGTDGNGHTLIGISIADKFYLYDLGPNTWNPDPKMHPWPMFKHDPQRTGNYELILPIEPQDTTPPNIVFTPAHESSNVQRNTTVLVGVTDDGVGVNQKSLEFILNGQSIPKDSLVIDETNKGLLVSYNGSFEYGSKVDIEVRVEDNNTNRVVHKISFDIEKNPDNLPPTVSSCRPKPGDKTTSPYRIHAEFYDNVAVEPDSIWIRVNGEDVNITIEEIIGGKKVVGYSADYFPKDTLSGEVLVEVGAKDVNGNEMIYNYSFTVKESGLKKVVSSDIQGKNNINNNPENALELDNKYVSLGVGGEITIDMGIDGIVDIPGNDFTVYESKLPLAPSLKNNSTNQEGYSVFVSNDTNNWTFLGKGMGTTSFDLAKEGLKSARYVKIVDDGDGDPNEQSPGFDLDGIVIKSGEEVKDKKLLVTQWGEVKRTALLQNYPNPFNPETWIPYELAEPSYVVIQVYNSTGQLVRTLDLGDKEIGVYTSKNKAAYWDGRNDLGEAVASGIYFYLIREQLTETRKMILVK